MKKLFLFLPICLLATALGSSLRKTVDFVIFYEETGGAPDLFVLYHSTDLTVPLTNWPVYTTIPGTNRLFTITIEPGVHFFTMTASNFWGQSDFFPTVSLPGVPRNGVLQIK